MSQVVFHSGKTKPWPCGRCSEMPASCRFSLVQRPRRGSDRDAGCFSRRSRGGLSPPHGPAKQPFSLPSARCCWPCLGVGPFSWGTERHFGGGDGATACYAVQNVASVATAGPGLRGAGSISAQSKPLAAAARISVGCKPVGRLTMGLAHLALPANGPTWASRKQSAVMSSRHLR